MSGGFTPGVHPLESLSGLLPFGTATLQCLQHSLLNTRVILRATDQNQPGSRVVDRAALIQMTRRISANWTARRGLPVIGTDAAMRHKLQVKLSD
jgi:hypothetical protein